MADTAIEWAQSVWNPTTGCDKVSPGCDNCYALTMAKRLKGMGQAKYQTDGDPRTSGPGFGLAVHHDALSAPLGWRKPQRVFVNSMSDLFHARVPREFIVGVWDVMARTPQHTYQILTKRPDRMARVLREMPAGLWDLPLPNVWLGTSIESQKYAAIRIPPLQETPAAVRWLSVEPLLDEVTLLPWLNGGFGTVGPDLHWVVVGGESGRGARPMRVEWARSLRDECEAAGVPFFFKQAGSALARQWGCTDAKGGHNPAEWPEPFPRQYPVEVAA